MESLNLFMCSQMKERYICYDFMKDMCFPCAITAEMTSQVHREEGYSAVSKNCGGRVVGNEGMKTCLWTGFLCVLGWPVSPGLGVFAMLQRNYLNIIYGGLKGNRDPNSVVCSSAGLDMCCACVCWPWALRQHQRFLREQEEEGLLRFPWEQEYLEHHKRPPTVNTQVCYLVGPPESGKSLLFERLLGAAGGTEREALNKIRVGARPVGSNATDVHFLEYWDVPAVCLDLINPRRDHIFIFTFDSNSEESFDNMVELSAIAQDSRAVVVGTKEDVEGGHIGGKAVLYSKVQHWADTRGWDFMGMSTLDNSSVTRLARFIQNMAFPS